MCVLICLGPFISLAFAGVSRALLGIKQMLPARLGHRSGKVLRGVVNSVLGSFFGAPLRESKPHQRLDIFRHFMKSSMTPFGSLSGVFFSEPALN